MNKELENKLNEIIDYIKNTDSYKSYLKAKNILETRTDLIIIIDNIKKIQKEIVNNSSNKKDLEKELNENIKLLENDITYCEYNKYLSEVNNLLAIFENKLNKYFNDVFK